MTASADSVPPQVRRTMERIVSAVRDGDDARLRPLIEGFAREADIDAVFLLRQWLYRDLWDEPDPG